MKSLLVCILFLFCASISWSQAAEQDVIHTQFLYLDRVYVGSYGYKIAYGTLAEAFNVAYLPYTWFADNWGSFGRVFYTRSGTAPYMLVYSRNQDVSNIHLYIPENIEHLAVRTLFNYDPALQEKFNLEPEDFELFPTQ